MAKPLSVGLSLLYKCLVQQQGNESLQLANEICEYFDKTLSIAEQGTSPHPRMSSYVLYKITLNSFRFGYKRCFPVQ